MIRQLATSPDGQWAALRTGRELRVLAGGAGPALARAELAGDDVDLAIVNGPPNVLVAATRDGTATQVVLYTLPELEAAARVDLAAPARIVSTSGGRLVLVTTDNRELAIVRAAGRGLASHPVDLQGGVLEFAVGIERNQLVIGQLRKLEVWDAVSGRPLRRLALDLPPPPRTVGSAAGHLWVTRAGSDEVFVYRLSDARPFRHYVGAPVEDVISHPVSPLVVLVTARGLVRLHCFAHSLFAIDAPWQPGVALAQLVAGDDIALLGLAPGSDEPWRVPIGGLASAGITEVGEVVVETGFRPSSAAAPPEAIVTAADKLRAMRAQVAHADAPPVLAPAPAVVPAAPRAGSAWREPLAMFGRELARGVDSELPSVAVDTELGELAHRLGLSVATRRALIALYAAYLVGEPALAIARIGRALGDWTEALGQGQLAALAMLDRAHGKVALAPQVTDLLDGAPPREIRIVGGSPTTPRAGAFRVARASLAGRAEDASHGRTDAEIEADLAARLGRIAVVETGRIAAALLEARLHGATAVAWLAPTERPRPWPQGAGLVLVLYGAASSWIADLPAL